jgi:hypothetical protein
MNDIHQMLKILKTDWTEMVYFAATLSYKCFFISSFLNLKQYNFTIKTNTACVILMQNVYLT